ncbi:MAG: hypothetical protein QOK19_1469 [Solirubrobacteraceae bacterium]|jgi:uncharacterized protein YggT (Ycf19 family)|nr:hypothetical protein [Solirubrobacterales bacterium]MEA2215908.1 hypothetical protein [Solirubrobacteraceae bacterium]
MSSGVRSEQPGAAVKPGAESRVAAAPEPNDPRDGRVTETAVLTLWVGRVVIWLVYAFVTLGALLLLIAFFLQLTGANPAAPFAAWVYRSSDVLLQPFRALYPTERLHTGKSELNLSIVFAIFMYGLFAVLFSVALEHLDRWIRRVRLRSGGPAFEP